VVGPLRLACALGRSGLVSRKREGDGGTPRGAFRINLVYYRADRIRRPRTELPTRPLKPNDGWCDAPADRNYNRAVRHPYPASAEELWRKDRLYDLIGVLDHNMVPRVRGAGSAIFLHVAEPGYTPTAGCLALSRADVERLLAVVGRNRKIRTSR
jgi:L,D-peptidoglycan transpeptidase YkuD (ErfK/YbiS/YcfS/YnhG family)